ncbi:MAG: 30S ribosomal protein S8 [Elusimicrobia bacterium]|nr:30S ribosomal protein S8 [Elusimicrobiota bacterium]
MSQDPIADFLAAFKNGIERGKDYIDFPASSIIGEILKIMKQRGFVENFKKITDRRQGFFRIFPKYEGSAPVLKGARRVSRLSRRIYSTAKKIPKVVDGYGICIVTTSKGVMDGESARAAGVGGEILCYLW